MKNLNWGDRFLNSLEDFEPRLKVSFRVLPMIFYFILFSWLVANRNELRGELPRTIDVFSYAGNLDSTVVALVFSALVIFPLVRFFVESKKVALTIIGLTAFVTALSLNIFVETSLGMRVLDLPNTSDPGDVIFSTIMSVIVALTCLRVKVRD